MAVVMVVVVVVNPGIKKGLRTVWGHVCVIGVAIWGVHRRSLHMYATAAAVVVCVWHSGVCPVMTH